MSFTIQCDRCESKIKLKDEFSRNIGVIGILKLNHTLNFSCTNCGNNIYEDNVHDFEESRK